MAPLSAREARLARRLPSYRDFVDDALFHPAYGYYATGAVRFGEGGHYDTFPTAMAPLWGRMVAGAARRVWEQAGRPARFDVCEIGAGNGRLCLDTVVAVATRAEARGWREFARAFRYRVVERSPALVRRQRATLGPLAKHVTWTRADLSQPRRRALRFGGAGFVVANEVLDCLAHHQVIRDARGDARVVFVAASLGGRPLDRAGLARAMTSPRRDAVRFREVALPLAAVPGLTRHLARYCPEWLTARRTPPPYFACPDMPILVRAVARLYDASETLWIDYGERRPFHLRTPASRRVFAGPSRSGRSVYDAPGRDDVTFMADFSVVEAVARELGLAVTHWGGQGALATAGGVTIGPREIALIAETRALGWLLDVVGRGPERAWRQGGLTWTRRGARGGGLRAGIERDVEEFLGRRPTRFRMLALSTGPSAFRRGAPSRARRKGC